MNVSKKTVTGDGTNNSATGNRISVLVVDDDPIIRTIHKALLRRSGMEVEVAADGQQAVNLHRMGASYNLVFMDMEMPVMDGPQATRELREMGVESMIVGVTSRDLDSDIQAFMAAGLNYCFVKPLTIEKVIPLIEELTGNI
ncbi:Response_reg domain-containing protein [Cephalotus follicularis]|uniref:Response_reg domain-containing protein n=1 Tax=Cephalotus follicularis TaxID=3775 RepID=A0A1Q3CUR4_CEPFO|nr:Response_reg domain-containing protein [Cephalotus follicularis]